MRISKPDPLADKGIFFPAEWEEHESTWLTYPKENESWPNNFPAVCDEYNAFVKEIAKGEKVNIITENTNHSARILDKLDKKGVNLNRISCYEITNDDCWCRDHGPLFAIRKKPKSKILLNWEYNAWGGKFPFEKDNQIPLKISEHLNLQHVSPGIILEGGSIEVNGAGSLITTEACLLNKNRNPQLSKQQIEEYLTNYLGITNFIWLKDGIEGDDTDGHIDDIARFTDKRTVLIASETHVNDPNFHVLKENLEILKKSILEDGNHPDIVELPMPSPVYNDNIRFPMSYANFYICNHAVIVPVFKLKTDEKALQIIQSCFPEKKVVGLPANNIVYGGGSWHCLSQQETALRSGN